MAHDLPFRRSLSVFSTHCVDDEDGDDDECHSILRKHKSLPPRRKNVHFADGFGKPLVSVYTIVTMNTTSMSLCNLPSENCRNPINCYTFVSHSLPWRMTLENDYKGKRSVWRTRSLQRIPSGAPSK